MFTKSFAAAALAGLIGVATLGLSATSASAGGGYWVGGGGYWNNGGNYNYNYNYNYRVRPTYPPYPGIGNYYFKYRPQPYYQVQPTVQQICKPTYKTVQVFKPYYGWVWQTVYAGQRCWYQQAYPSQSYRYGGW